MRLILTCMVLSVMVGLPLLTSAQKYKYDKKAEVVSKDGAAYLKVEKKGCGIGQLCSFNVYDDAGNKIMIVTMESFKDPAAVNQSNPEGYVRYSTYVFPTLDQKAEYAIVRSKPEKLVKDIDNNALIKEGKLNEESVNEFVLVNGSKFSEQRSQIIRVITN